jgi:hypothetical protein
MADMLRFFVPIEKVDKEARTVSGWATTETIDKQGEIVDYGASKAAFAEWRGNIREMHEPKAVGKSLEALADDKERKVYVKAHISKGAEDTWQKCLDGTLTGFSIGGQTIDKMVQLVKDAETKAARTVTRITKYRLNELSLVDNPANPDAQFQLVKMDTATGTLHQTAVVEDSKKIVMTEAQDHLGEEVREHREKADGLAKKVLTEQDISNLPDDDFGVVRRYSSPQGTAVKERLFAMPDKVHAFSALKKVVGYPLSDEEREEVHKKAAGILGTSHKQDECTLCKTHIEKEGENTKMEQKQLEELLNKVAALVQQVETVIKAWEGAHAPVAGAKATPAESGANPTSAPAVSPSAPEKTGAADGVQAQDPKGAYPAEGPVKTADGSPTEKADMSKPDSAGVQTQETPAVPAVAGSPSGEVKAKDGEGTASSPAKAGDPGDGSVQTQDPAGSYPAAGPVKAAGVVAVTEDGEEDKDKDKKPMPAALAAATEKTDKPGDIQKTEGTDNDMQKQVDSLRKQVEELRKQPKPRKHLVEKTYGAGEEGNSEDAEKEAAEIQKAYDETMTLVKSGKPLTREQEARRSWVVNKMLEGKVGDIRKIQ